MKTIKQIHSLILMAGVIAFTPACSVKKSAYGDAKTGYKMEYRMPKGEPLHYDLVSEFNSNMKVMGQEFDVESNARNLFTLTPAGLSNGNNLFNVTIDTVYMYINSPGGEIVPDMAGIPGSQFLFEVSPKGKEVDCSGAEELKYKLGESEEMNLSSDFMTFFPDLPDRPVKPGDRWSNLDTLLEKSSSGFLQFITQNENTIESIEPFDGFDCLMIRTTYTGSIHGEGTMQEAETKTSGSIEGEMTWYFAYKEGRYIKSMTTGRATTKTIASAPGREIEIPSIRDYSIETALVTD